VGLPIPGAVASLTRRTIVPFRPVQEQPDRRPDRARYHLGRGRRARERGRFDAAAREARRALAHQPDDPWAHALLGQTLARQRRPDLPGARRALERACALSPRNGYFVGLLLEVFHAQGDVAACDDALARAWWSGAPVDRWLTPTTLARRGRSTSPNPGPAAAAVADGLLQPVGA
jgi:predicted Zn-dependent protease